MNLLQLSTKAKFNSHVNDSNKSVAQTWSHRNERENCNVVLVASNEQQAGEKKREREKLAKRSGKF